MSAAMPNERPVALITGASTGIGAELARVFARNGHEVVLVARRESKLAELADTIAAGGFSRPLVLPVDLQESGASARIKAELAARGVTPQYVVNNAGFGLFGEATSLDVTEQLAMIDLNVRVLTGLSLAFVDSLTRHRGGILNIGSVASFLPGPGMAVYYATKAFVLTFSEALHQELAGRDVRVTVLCPGPVPTGFQARAGIDRVVGSSVLTWTADEVARLGYSGLMEGRRVIVPGIGNKMITFLPRILPRGFFLRAVARSQLDQGKSPKSS